MEPSPKTQFQVHSNASDLAEEEKESSLLCSDFSSPMKNQRTKIGGKLLSSRQMSNAKTSYAIWLLIVAVA